jgi:DNA-directed RNA polymerase beta subunit
MVVRVTVAQKLENQVGDHREWPDGMETKGIISILPIEDMPYTCQMAPLWTSMPITWGTESDR